MIEDREDSHLSVIFNLFVKLWSDTYGHTYINIFIKKEFLSESSRFNFFCKKYHD